MRSVVFSPDKTLMLSGSEYKSIKLCDKKDVNLIKSFANEHRFGVSTVTFSTDGTKIYQDLTIIL